MKATIHPPAISQDAQDFLASILWTADSPDYSRRPFQNSTVYDFHPEFIAAVEAFIDGFKSHMENVGFDMDRLEYLERSFGGNAYFSLSGHGCGFFDEYADPERTLGNELQALLVSYAGQYRFEELESNLAKFKGKIHLAHRTAAFRREYLAKMFSINA